MSDFSSRVVIFRKGSTDGAIVDLGVPEGFDVLEALLRTFPGLRVDHERQPARFVLTRRERDVITLLAKGVPYADIGKMLGLRLGTVQSYIKRLYAKLDINSKAEAALIAAELRLV